MLLFNGSLNAAENLFGRRLSDKQKAEVILSHNAGNELYGIENFEKIGNSKFSKKNFDAFFFGKDDYSKFSIDDFARVSTKARLLEDFSSYERRVRKTKTLKN